MKTSMQMKEEKTEFIEVISKKIEERSYEYLEKKVAEGFKEFCQEGRISIPVTYGDIWREAFKSENLSTERDLELCKAIADLAKRKLDEHLEKDGWKFETGFLKPLDNSDDK